MWMNSASERRVRGSLKAYAAEDPAVKSTAVLTKAAYRSDPRKHRAPHSVPQRRPSIKSAMKQCMDSDEKRLGQPSSDAFLDDSGSMVGECPNCKLRTIRNPQLSEDPIQVFLDGAFREVQLVCNFLI